MDFQSLEGFQWLSNGQSLFTGKLLKLSRKLDGLFLTWAEAWKAEEYLFPVFISAAELNKLDYFRSFPHLVTFPVVLKDSNENLNHFIERPLHNGNIQLTESEPIQEVLTPAACYHFYIHYQKTSLHGPLYLTTRANCFRREKYYLPLQRQWNFSMREIVCIGTAEEVSSFVSLFQEKLQEFFRSINLTVEWKEATDPFFNPTRNPKYLSQKLDPVKTEIVFRDLAIGSLNLHRNYFGETFEMLRDGNPAFSGCVAFGLERWMFAFLSRFGTSEASWPL